jgi:tetratricopeptide (TPR) repeat protein
MRFKIAALFEFEGKTPPTNATDLASITPLVLKRFGFLPQPVLVTVEGDEVVIQYPEESSAAQAEAARLAERAGKRAAEGHYEKAIGILKRVLELQPSLHKARRDLAMAYVETGDIDNATNHLIEVLRLDPGDAWSWVVLANLYIREKSDKETGEKFLRKALEIAPNDAWALNSLASVTFERGKTDEAISLFEHAIQSNPEFANAYWQKSFLRHHRQDAGHGHPVVCGRYPQVGKGRLFGAENHRADADAGQRALRIPVQLPARHAYRAPPARHIQAAPARAIPFRPAHGE